jgi:hypothetical protein
MKFKFMLGSLILGCVMLLVSCAPAAPAALAGCKADLSSVFVIRRGADSAVVLSTYTVTNPNPYMVSVDDLVYNMDAGMGFVLYEQIPYKYFIPAGEKITIQGTTVLEFSNAVAERLFQGDTMAKAVGTVLPMWKSVGNMPAGITKEMWAAVPAKDVVFAYTVTVHTNGNGTDKLETTKGSSKTVK